jgi:HSP20 family protein
MPKKRDPLAGFQSMRREIDELFSDVWARAGIPPRQRVGFRPRIDVYYAGDPPRAVVKADLAGVDPDELSLEVRGHTLIISGERSTRDSEARVYQQIEIEHGPFVREIELRANVDPAQAQGTYQDGLLTVELPITDTEHVRTVPISTPSEAEGEEGTGR